MHDAPAWVTVTVWPATVIVPLRGVTAVLADTDNCVTPLPATLLPPVIPIQAALLLAVPGAARRRADCDRRVSRYAAERYGRCRE